MDGLESFLTNDFKNIECFLEALPKDIRAFRTYFKSSLSMQGASVSHPRAMIGSPDGGFFLTFNGHPHQKGYEEIEVLALDKNVRPTQWIPAVIKQQSGKLSLTKNVSKCSVCHGNPVRPIWGKYPIWPNSFGSIDDWLPDPNDLGKGSNSYEQDIAVSDYGLDRTAPRLSKKQIEIAKKESDQFRTFRQMAKNHPRYSKLEKASDATSPVFPFSETYRTRNHAFRPNLTIGSIMTMRQNEILFSRIINGKIYQNYKNSLLHYGKCSGAGDIDYHNETIHTFMSRAYESVYGKPIPSNSYQDTASLCLYFNLVRY